MVEVVKVKRPLSVWLSQILLAATVLFLVSSFVVALSRIGMERAWSSMLQVGRISVLVVLAICVWAFIDLLKPRKTGRWVVLAAFSGMALFSSYIIGEAVIRARNLSEEPASYMITFVLMTTIFLFPYLILSAFLLFSRKVKMFFDPSFIPQIDESSTIFHEPPPPPRFDE